MTTVGAEEPAESDGLSGGVIAAIAVSSFVFVAALVGLLKYFFRSWNARSDSAGSSAPGAPAGTRIAAGKASERALEQY